MLDIFPVGVGLVRTKSAMQTSPCELHDVLFGVGTLLVLEQSSLEDRTPSIRVWLALVAQPAQPCPTVSPPTVGHQNGQRWAGVTVGKTFFSLFFVLTEATADTQRHVCKAFHANIRRSDQPMIYNEWNLTRKRDPTIKYVITSNRVKCTHLPPKMFDVHVMYTPLWRDRPWTLPNMFLMPIPRRDLWGFCFYSFCQTHLVVRSAYIYVYKCLEGECWILNQSGKCTLRPPSLHCCFRLHHRQISPDTTFSPTASTATQTWASKD